MIGILQSIIYIIGALLLTVFFHELAHMIVALLCKVKVEAFSLGFGKVLLHKKIWGIDFRLSAIPLGGYVKFEKDLSKFKYSIKHILKNIKNWWNNNTIDLQLLSKRYSRKLAIILAGVIINFLIACICYLINYGSIRLGLFIDFKLIQYIFTKDYEGIYVLITMLQPNLFILQLGLINLFACLTNLLPIPALDGGFIWLFLLEKKIKNFPNFLDKITKIGFIVLIILQIILIYWIWLI